GGGAKGSFQYGVWQALRKVKYDYGLVVGSSVGALNMIQMVQNSFFTSAKLWQQLDLLQIFKVSAELKSEYDQASSELDQFKLLFKQAIKEREIDISPFKELLNREINIKKIKKSKITGILTVLEVPAMKGHEIVINDLACELVIDYLIASCSAVPAFPPHKINDKSYIDGGFFDNLPIQSAIDYGATEIIAVDLDFLGNKRKYDEQQAQVHIINSNWDLGGFLDFDPLVAKRNIKLGYLATLRYFEKQRGFSYSFNKRSRKLQGYSDKFNIVCQKIMERTNTNITFSAENNLKFTINNRHQKKSDHFLRVLEFIMETNNYDPTIVYNIDKVIRDLEKKYLTIDLMNVEILALINNIIHQDDKNNEDFEKFVLALLKMIETNNFNGFSTLANFTSESALMAIFLSLLRAKGK
ncbi:MAG: patatin-like phospholipase family protein, partial [Erysipelotrichaceae bacterium]